MSSPDAPRRLRTPDELFDHAVTRGIALRRRRHVLRGAGVATVAVLLVAASAAFIGDDARHITNVATPGESTTTTADPLAGLGKIPEDTTTTTAESAAVQATTPTTRRGAVTTTTAPKDPPTPCTPSTPAPSANRSRLAVVRFFENGDSDIWSMKTDGTDEKQLTSQTGQERYPIWDPMGSRIVYVGAGELRTMNADGSEDRSFGPPGLAPKFALSWSPDGTTIAFTSNFRIWLIDADGSNPRQITNLESRGNPTWSPDACWIVFVGFQDEIYKVRSDGSGLARLPIDGDWPTPDWGPGGKIAFERQGDIFVCDADGKNVTRLTTGGSEVHARSEPDWSPDGTRIAFSYSLDPSQPGEVFTMRASDGGDVVQITNNARPEGEAAW